MTNRGLLKVNKRDNVAMTLLELSAGQSLELEDQRLSVKEHIPTGHKIALEDIKKGQAVIKYGYLIGITNRDISRGSWVHTHNIQTSLKDKIEYSYQQKQNMDFPRDRDLLSFQGYRRDDGQVGIRNEIWIINAVGCINKPAEKMAALARQKFKAEIEDGVIDGIESFSHHYGCSQLGKDLENTQKILAGLVKHPNAAGVLVVSLGCENNRLSSFKSIIGDYNPERVKFITLQETEDDEQTGLREINKLMRYAAAFKREKVALSELKVGLQCGASDSFSGITANPLIGKVSDHIISQGGTVILAEVNEMFGAEHILMERAVNQTIFARIVELINGFKDYYLDHGQEIYENPSPGNKRGGLTTLEEKSLGCIEKGGSSPVQGVFLYGDRISRKGLNLLETPGNDVISTTAEVAAGAQIVLFTTGLGTPLGSVVPTIKIASNSQLAARKKSWIDFDAGQLLSGKRLDNLAGELLNYLITVASGDRQTRNEINDYREISLFKQGIIL